MSFLVTIWGEFNSGNKRGEIPQWQFTVLLTLFLILHRGIIPNHPVSGGSKGYWAWGGLQEVTCFLWNLILISAAPLAPSVWHEDQLFPDKVEHFIPSPKTHPTIIFSHIPKLLVAIAAVRCVSAYKYVGNSKPWVMILKCHKELFYKKGREKGDDYGYTEPYSQRDLQSLVWSQSDCETQSIKRIITQDITMAPLHSVTYAFEEIYVSLAWLLCLCVSLIEFTCLHGFVCASVWKHGWLCMETSETDILCAWH